MYNTEELDISISGYFLTLKTHFYDSDNKNRTSWGWNRNMGR